MKRLGAILGIAALLRRYSMHALLRSLSCVLALSAVAYSSASIAAPTDCLGTSVDGRATCTAPILGQYTYTLCNVSQLFIGVAQQAKCQWSILGTPPWQDPDSDVSWTPYDTQTTDISGLAAMIQCMGGTDPIVWAGQGEPVGAEWCPVPPVQYKYGVEVVGAAHGIGTWYSGVVVNRSRTATCPAGTTPVGSNPQLPDYCKAKPKCNCETTGDPMGIVNGDQNLDETDILPFSDSPLQFSRSYRSSGYYRPMAAAKLTGTAYVTDGMLNPEWDLTPGFGDYWRHTYSSTLMVESQPNMMASVLRPSGVTKHFSSAGTSLVNEDSQGDRLAPTYDGGSTQTGWLYTAGNQQEKYAMTGQLSAIQTLAGRKVTLNYDNAGLLLQATDDVGRYLTFQYNPQHQLSAIVDVAGNTINYGYTGQMLSSVTYPDSVSRSYLYHENPTGANGDLFGMTGIVDELGTRYATFGYDNGSSRAYTELAGGVDSAVRTVVDASHVSITDAMGKVQTFTTGTVNGVDRSSSMSQPAGSGNAASNSSTAFDGAGAVASEDSVNAVRTCFVNDQVRLVETMRIEGLETTQACSSVETVGVTLPTGSRMINTVWHPTWPLVARRAEPKKLTTYVYNGQPDPTASGATLTCAPASAVLMDGTPIAVLCKKVEQATTDATGSRGFTAPLQSGVAARVNSWTYNAMGQVLTATDPRNYSTTYTYYPSTSFTGTGMAATGHTMGDLQTVKNALGHTTTYSAYNLYGQPLTVVDPNSVTTTNVYDSRRRLRSTTTGTDVTSYTYDAAGQPKTVTFANGLVITNNYDGAHRLTQVSDSAGNAITYTLDNAGNRIGEQVTDANGVLARNISRSFDILGRVQSVTGAAQ